MEDTTDNAEPVSYNPFVIESAPDSPTIEGTIDKTAESSDLSIDKTEAESSEQKTVSQNVNTLPAETVSGKTEEPATNDTELVKADDEITVVKADDDVTESHGKTLQGESNESDEVVPIEKDTDNTDERVADENCGSIEKNVLTTETSDQVEESTTTVTESIGEERPDSTEKQVSATAASDKTEESTNNAKQPVIEEADGKEKQTALITTSDETAGKESSPEDVPLPSDPAGKESSPEDVPPPSDPEDVSSGLSRKKSFENEFEKFLSHPTKEPTVSDNDSKSSDIKASVEQEPEMKTGEDFKKFNQICTEETSNSSWYKMAETKEPMDITETSLLGDENSNMSIPENGSVVSSNIGEDSRLSFQVDDGSNLSLPEDGSSVPTFAGHQPVFDESANMNPPSNVTFLQPGTPSSVNADTMSESTPTSKRNRRGTLQQAAEDANEHGHNITAADIFEYQWPQDVDADWFILQEQLSVYLDVKSFKRKYPEIFRRVCDKLEKDFLREKGVVTETQCDLGLTALKSEDVHELMSRDYPSKYKEFLKILHEREKKRIAEKLKELDAPKLEKEKMVEYTKRAMKSASDWNRRMLKERSKERRAYFDMQTFTTHFPKSKFRHITPTPTEQTSYPISLIPGQFQEYYKKYSPEELKHFPLNTTVFIPQKKVDPVVRLQEQIIRRQQQQLSVQQTVLVKNVVDEPPKAANPIGSESDNDGDCSGGNSSDSGNEGKKKQDEKAGNKTIEKLSNKLKKKEKSSSREASKEKSIEPIAVKKESVECHICKKEKDKSKVPVEEEFINCSECKKPGHPSCLDLTDAMVKVIKTYPWQCMECKTCVQCMDPFDEDKMLFCDNCDRGYHTFCVGLKSLPTGKWECKSCTGDTTPIIPLPRPPPKAKRGRKPKYPNGAPTTPAKALKEKEISSKQTPVRSTPRREAKDLEKANAKDAKETK